MLQTLIDQCGIFPKLCEYVIDFRWKQRDTEVGPLPIRFRLLPNHGYGSSSLPSSFVIEFKIIAECAYGVRYVEFTNRDEESPWSLRQFAVYHKYVPKASARCSTWVLVGATQRTEKSLDQYQKENAQLQKAHPFELHIIFLDVAIASWRPYLAYLLEKAAQLVRTIDYVYFL
jgi:hypothetical protein